MPNTFSLSSLGPKFSIWVAIFRIIIFFNIILVESTKLLCALMYKYLVTSIFFFKYWYFERRGELVGLGGLVLMRLYYRVRKIERGNKSPFGWGENWGERKWTIGEFG